jgi:hypothetical protein
MTDSKSKFQQKLSEILANKKLTNSLLSREECQQKLNRLRELNTDSTIKKESSDYRLLSRFAIQEFRSWRIPEHDGRCSGRKRSWSVQNWHPLGNTGASLSADWLQRAGRTVPAAF